MIDLPAQRLHEVMAPVWEKHPETRPEGLTWCDAGDDSYGCRYAASWLRKGRQREPDEATLLCESGMVRWLAEHDDYVQIWRAPYRWHAGSGAPQFEAPTLLEALAAACLAVPQEKT